jgi:hypothetical protein
MLIEFQLCEPKGRTGVGGLPINRKIMLKLILKVCEFEK